MEHILSLSYGKDSLACLGAIEQLGWPLDRIVHAEVWATDTIPADLPPMVEFKHKADAIIKKRWGIEVERARANRTYQDRFYSVKTKKAKHRPGMIYGWPFSVTGAWCNSDVKMPPLKAVQKGGNIVYIGIAADEPNRFHSLSERGKSGKRSTKHARENHCHLYAMRDVYKMGPVLRCFPRMEHPRTDSERK